MLFNVFGRLNSTKKMFVFNGNGLSNVGRESRSQS